MRLTLLPLLLLAACATPNAGTPAGSTAMGSNMPAARAAADFPPVLGSFRRSGAVTDYGAATGLGRSARYQRENGDFATVYLYDRGQRRAPEGPSSPDVVAELSATRAELQAVVAMGRYRSVQPAEAELLIERRSDGKPGMRCNNYNIVQGDGAATGDGVCVTVLNGQFLKVRSTAANGNPRRASLVAAELILAVQDAPSAAP